MLRSNWEIQQQLCNCHSYNLILRCWPKQPLQHLAATLSFTVAGLMLQGPEGMCAAGNLCATLPLALNLTQTTCLCEPGEQH